MIQPKNRPWNGVLAIEDELTVDGRLILPGVIVWPELPVPLLELVIGPQRAVSPVGSIDSVIRVGNQITGYGRYWGQAGPRRRLPIGIDLMDGTIEERDGQLVFTGAARLYGATISTQSAWPGAYIRIGL